MNRNETIKQLNQWLLQEMPQYAGQVQSYPQDTASQRRLLRALMNVRPPEPISDEFLALQDALLSVEAEEKGIVEGMTLPVETDTRLVLWQGDITRLKVDAIVNAANDALLGCFMPGHACIDNAIHSAAGVQLRLACHELMQNQGYSEPTGRAKLTPGYNLPARYVLHTVGPIIHGSVTQIDRDLLASCYRSCLAFANEKGLKSVAFCCISTGEFHFPNQEAAEIAIKTVKEFLKGNSQIEKVIFNVYKDEDATIYRGLLNEN